MIITNSSVMLKSESYVQKEYNRQESLRVIYPENQDNRNKGSFSEDQLVLSDDAVERLRKDIEAKGSQFSIKLELSEEEKNKIRLIESFLERLTGREVRLKIARKIKIKNNMVKIHIGQNDRFRRRGRVVDNRPAIDYRFHESYFEKESMSFKSKGKITTADGREIEFEMQQNIQRSQYSQRNITIQAGNKKLIDPLIINFDGGAPQLTDEKYNFDLDNDGNKDLVSLAGGNSGFLAIDKNNDGLINNGSELFGPESGNGFADLAAYDEDGNGWIDENDAVFNSLLIWTKDENGNDILDTIVDHNMGAIYLGNVSGIFSLRDDNMDIQGMIKDNGIYLTEDGRAGAIHNIDLVV